MRAMVKEESKLHDVFERFAGAASRSTGSVWAFTLAFLIVVVWAATGPIFNYSETWQLVINTGTTIITFLMVFLIQHAQNKDMRALQLKLNELIAAVEGASNRLIDVEDLSDSELDHLYSRFKHLAKSASRVTHGAKLTIDDDKESDDDTEGGGPSSSAESHGHPHSAAEKKPVRAKGEAKGRKR
jgi:low affinity Fe/Cu permease